MKLARTLPEISSCGDLQPRDGVGIICVRAHSISPPVELDLVIAQGEEDNDRCERGTGIHCCLQEVCYLLARSVPTIRAEY